ncbi:hypothetical protein [Nocardia nepalensis]|uniref:hypothetical protein n=1 Tax=Nocardia nepalensis TaxID=3375448 RepID=UPI003B672BA2
MITSRTRTVIVIVVLGIALAAHVLIGTAVGAALYPWLGAIGVAILVVAVLFGHYGAYRAATRRRTINRRT